MTEPEDSDLLAAEYVLGTLDGAERASVRARLRVDPDLAGAVEAWQSRLSPLSEATRDVAPPDGLYEVVAERLFGTGGDATASLVVLDLRRRVRRWRAATAGFAALAASLILLVGIQHGAAPASRFSAVLQRDAGAPAMVVDVDLGRRRLTVQPVAAASPAGKSYQLWIIDPALGAPRSLGLVPPASAADASLAPFDPAVITGATYAVTVEPPGGSPDGKPSTTPILTGRLVPTSP